MNEKVYLVNGIRTPFGSFGGTLKNVEVEDLAAEVIKELLHRSNLDVNEVDAVHFGSANTAESKDVVAPIIARQALLKAGLPATVISSTVDRACCSGTEAIKRGYDMIRLGEADVVIAGGVQSLSRTPHIVRNARWEGKLNHFLIEDCLIATGYKDYNPVAVDAGEVAIEYGITREEQDHWAFLSQMRYQDAKKEGKFEQEIMKMYVTDKKNNKICFDNDEFPKPNTTLEGLNKLKPIYGSPTVTAGNAPGLNDGASAVLLISETKLKKLGLESLAEIVCAVSIADQPRNIAVVPGLSIKKALTKMNLDVEELKRIEINEAFAAVPLVSSKVLGDFDNAKIQRIRNKLNVNGGAIAIGHPLAASGARIVTTLAYELKRSGGGFGAAAICGGLAQGDAIIIKV